MGDFLKKYGLKDPVCLYKWTWSTIRLMEGSTNSCHRIKSDTITPENYSDFHNTPTKIKHRKLMQSGVWPGDGCEYCRDIEHAGGISDRTDLQEDDYLAPIEMDKDPKKVRLTPRMVEVYFNNLCNLNCIYCSGEYSTVWEAEEKKFGLRDPLELAEMERSRKQYPEMLKAHWKWMEEHAKYIAEYRILGGEPFFQPEFEQNIDFFFNNPCPDTRFIIFSNLKVENKRMRKLLDKVVDLQKRKHIKDFQLVCSFDCWGPQQEYIRTGLNLKQWEENFETVLKDYPSITIEIHGTIISLTMDTLPDLCAKVAKWHDACYPNWPHTNRIRPIKHSISFASGRPDMDVGIFPIGFFDKQFEQSIKNHTNPTTIKWLEGFWAKVNNQKQDNKKIKQLKVTLNEIDARRGTNWKELWPWLDEYEV
tara:strand:+ start:2741 stop:4000 length:1260 start_codon:yes stop_codon:yes gene_type:complete